MRLAWLTKLPTPSFPQRSDGPQTLLPEATFRKSLMESSPVQTPPQEQESPTGFMARLSQLAQSMKERIPAFRKPAMPPASPPFLQAAQNRLNKQIEDYAESPFERMLFGMKKKEQAFNISRAWADGIRSSDPQTRDAALSLFRSYLAFTGMTNSDQVSAHSQMKLLLFSPHLTEGPMGKAMLYDAILELPTPQVLEFGNILKKDFAHLPHMAQAMILKKMLETWKARDKDALDKDTEAFRKLMKSLVIQFYAQQQDSMDESLRQQEKIRVGFLKMRPVEEVYRKQLQEVEKRYRFKLRQLKKSRAQKIAEAEEERMRRIESIYDAMEGSLMNGLNDLNIEDLHQVVAG